MTPDADVLPEDPVLLQAMVLGLRAQIAGIEAANRAYEALVQALKVTIARLKKQRFGAACQVVRPSMMREPRSRQSLVERGTSCSFMPSEVQMSSSDRVHLRLLQ